MEKLNNDIKRYTELSDIVSKQESELKALKEELDDLEHKIWEQMDVQGVNSIRLAEVGLVSKASTIYGKVNDLQKAIEYFESTGLANEMLKQDIQKSRLNEYVRNLVKDGQPIPEGFEYYVKNYISIRR